MLTGIMIAVSLFIQFGKAEPCPHDSGIFQAYWNENRVKVQGQVEASRAFPFVNSYLIYKRLSRPVSDLDQVFMRGASRVGRPAMNFQIALSHDGPLSELQDALLLEESLRANRKRPPPLTHELQAVQSLFSKIFPVVRSFNQAAQNLADTANNLREEVLKGKLTGISADQSGPLQTNLVELARRIKSDSSSPLVQNQINFLKKNYPSLPNSFFKAAFKYSNNLAESKENLGNQLRPGSPLTQPIFVAKLTSLAGSIMNGNYPPQKLALDLGSPEGSDLKLHLFSDELKSALNLFRASSDGKIIPPSLSTFQASIRASAVGARLESYAKKITAYPGTIYLRPLAEMNGGEEPYALMSKAADGTYPNSPSQFADVWNRLHSLVQAQKNGGKNIKFVFDMILPTNKPGDSKVADALAQIPAQNIDTIGFNSYLTERSVADAKTAYNGADQGMFQLSDWMPNFSNFLKDPRLSKKFESVHWSLPEGGVKTVPPPGVSPQCWDWIMAGTILRTFQTVCRYSCKFDLVTYFNGSQWEIGPQFSLALRSLRKAQIAYQDGCDSEALGKVGRMIEEQKRPGACETSSPAQRETPLLTPTPLAPSDSAE